MGDFFSELRDGWRDLLGATLGLACGFACYSPLTSLFFRALEGEFHWTKTAAAIALVGLPITALCLPPAGLLLDRFGVRRVTLASAALLSVCFLWLSRMDGSLTSYYAASIALTVLGCVTGPIGYTRVIAEQFRRSRGFALATALLGVSLTAVVMPQIITPVIAKAGWRMAYLVLAGVAAGGGLIAFALIRKTSDVGAAPQTRAAETGVSLGQALASPAFWILGVAVFLISAAGLGFVSQFQSIAMERGADAATAALLLSALAGGVSVSRMIVGFALDRLKPTWVAATAIGISALGLGLFLTPLTPVALSAILLGFGIGAELDLLSFFCARRFGLKRYGAIYGALGFFYYMGLAAGGLLYASTRDHTHSYALAVACSAGMMAAAALLFLLFPASPMPAATATQAA